MISNTQLYKLTQNTRSIQSSNRLITTSSQFFKYSDLDIDTEVSQLSSRKLWQVLQFNTELHGQLEQVFIKQVKNELMARNDFDEGQAWHKPH